jgi:hypothetical protein
VAATQITQTMKISLKTLMMNNHSSSRSIQLIRKDRHINIRTEMTETAATVVTITTTIINIHSLIHPLKSIINSSVMQIKIIINLISQMAIAR